MSTQRTSNVLTAISMILALNFAPMTVNAVEIPVLPLVEVHAQAEIPVLPVVTVHPSATDIAAAQPVAASAASTSTVESRLPHMSFDMPYYSFGKMLPHVGKRSAQ